MNDRRNHDLDIAILIKSTAVEDTNKSRTDVCEAFNALNNNLATLIPGVSMRRMKAIGILLRKNHDELERLFRHIEKERIAHLNYARAVMSPDSDECALPERDYTVH